MSKQEAVTTGSSSRGISPQIYVACLAAYNNGRLHGRWINASLGEDHIRAEIDAMLESSPEAGAEEWAIHDYECFYGASLSEHEDIAEVAKLADLIDEHGGLAGEVYAHSGSIEGAVEALEENYQGAHRNLEDWAASFLEDTGGLQGSQRTWRTTSTLRLTVVTPS